MTEPLVVERNSDCEGPQFKQCATCLETKSIEDFYRAGKRATRRYKECKVCHNIRARRWAKAHKAETQAAVKKYNREKRRPGARQYGWGPRRDGIKAWLNALKENPCMECGRTYHFSVMDFDHVRGKKLFNVSMGHVMGIADDEILAEVQKCDLVCSNCHRLRTWRRKHNIS